MNVYQERESENMNHMNKQLYRSGTICPSAHLSTQKYWRSNKQRLLVMSSKSWERNNVFNFL